MMKCGFFSFTSLSGIARRPIVRKGQVSSLKSECAPGIYCRLRIVLKGRKVYQRVPQLEFSREVYYGISAIIGIDYIYHLKVALSR